MPSEKIAIPLDPEVARAYDAAPAEEKKKMQALLSLWLRDLVSAPPATLREIMDDASRKARARGLTPEALELAVSGRATLLVSGDAALLSLSPFQNITILTPRAFLELP